MTNTNRGGGPADEGQTIEHELDATWNDFRDALSGYLTTMTDPLENDHLIIELPSPDPSGEDGCAPYAQFTGFGDGTMIRAEISGDYYLLPQYRLGADPAGLATVLCWAGNDAAPDGDAEKRNWFVERPLAESEVIASQVVWVLRHHFGIAHPHLLTYRAWGPAAEAVERLGLCATADVPQDEPAPATTRSFPDAEWIRSQLAFEPTDHDELVGLVGAVLRDKYEGEPTIDEDGDFVLHHLDQPVWVRVRPDQPAVEIAARVAHGVHSRRATAVEIGLLNRDHSWVRWILSDRSIWQSLLLQGMPFAPTHLDAMLDVFFEAMSETRDDLALRTGARVA